MSLTVVADRGLAVTEKGLAALESLLYAKYQMYRNVYWHHAVRSATAMFKRLVRQALAAGRIRREDVAVATDDGLIHELQRGDTTGLAQALRERRLAKRALDLPATELPDGAGEWLGDEPDLVARVEDRLATELGLDAGELFLDFPVKQDMLGLDLPLARRDGTVVQLTGTGAAAHLGLARVAGELIRSARRLRVFVLRPVAVPAKQVIGLAALPREELRRRLADDRPLLGPG